MKKIAVFLIFFIAFVVSAQNGESFAIASVSNTRLYVGEALIYSLRIHLVGESADSQVIAASLVGFGRSSMQLEATVSSEVLGTTAYTIVEQNYLLFPLRIGTLSIDPFQVQIPETPFRGAETISSEALSVTVLPLPPNAPETFRNAIGQYEIEAAVSTNTLRSGDALTLNLTVSGSGNLEQLLAPAFALPETWRIFEENSTIEQESLLFGRKTFTWTIFPIGEGAVEIPSIELSYFNPQTESYESRRTPPIPLTLSPSAAIAAPNIPERSAITAAPIALMPPQMGLAPNPPKWFWYLWLLPPMIALVSLALRRPRREKVTRQAKAPNASRALQNFRNSLKTAQTAEPKAAYAQIESALNSYFAAKKVDVKALSPALKSEVNLCLEEASTGQYAPISPADVQELLRRSLALVNALEKERL